AGPPSSCSCVQATSRPAPIAAANGFDKQWSVPAAPVAGGASLPMADRPWGGCGKPGCGPGGCAM
ncbi:MAG TPA: zinc ribbon domain-containing protein, partial [Pirellulales bacterium]|nr:zinc ribbon domain-containing protein [Pirellulales bacterium]